ncbi:MAG: asparaginase [Paracoccaceae bacterium]
MRQTVDVLSLGGTIAMTPGAPGAGVLPTLTASDLLAAVPEAADVANVRAQSVLGVPSSEITLPDIVALAARITALRQAGSGGVVVTQGTDTIDETAFALDLLLPVGPPVIVTGAMRHPALPGADGPANLLAAIRCAASPACAGLGVLVVMGDVLHSAVSVAKTDTASPAAFASSSPVGFVSEGTPVIRCRPIRLPSLPDMTLRDAEAPFVPILTPALGDDDRMIRAAVGAGADGLVLALSGGGHTTAACAIVLAEAAQRLPVVFASRTGGGRVLSATYGQKGGEIDLASKGCVGAGDLSPLKARLLLSLLIMAGKADQFTRHCRFETARE